MDAVDIHVSLTDAQAWELAQFLKRVCFSDYRRHATCDEEAYQMVNAGERIRAARRSWLRTPIAPLSLSRRAGASPL